VVGWRVIWMGMGFEQLVLEGLWTGLVKSNELNS
jgi:hypothetical protein